MKSNFISSVLMGTCIASCASLTIYAENHAPAGSHSIPQLGSSDSSETSHADEVKLTTEAIRASGITSVPATKKHLTSTFVAPARIGFNTEAMAHVGTPVKGRVVELKAKTGQSVSKGDELLIIESPELGEAQSDLLQKKSAVAVAESTVDPAKESYERAKKLFDENQGISLAEVQKRQADWKAAEGAVKTATAAVAAAENRLQLLGMDQAALHALVATGKIAPRYAVHAPIAGQIIQREVTQGELVNPDRESLLVIADTSIVWVWADVPEARLSEVREGSEAAIEIAGGLGVITGKVTHIAPQLDANTRTGRVRIEVANPQGRLRPGMFARAALTSATGEKSDPVLAIPEAAVQTVEGKPAIFVPVAGEPNTFAKREVAVGKSVGGLLTILSGLKEGEAYVATGSFVLKADLGKAVAAHED